MALQTPSRLDSPPLAFVGPRPEGQQARHLNGIRNDNRLANLCWGTVEENRADTVLHGTSIRGIRNPKAKLNVQQVLAIRAMRAAGHEQKAIAALFGVTQTTVSGIVRGRFWKHV